MTKALETDQKTLEINLDPQVYGAFAEIGAGQEVARYFFQVGAAAGTIAKTMSAYDKLVSDDVYGTEPSGRYVCESRLYKMLDHEYNLMMRRLRNDRPDATIFAFADTVSAVNYSRTIKGDGWLGLRFQLAPDEEPNDLVLHVKMKDKSNQLQQQAVGILGVNMVYGCYRYFENPKVLIESLMDGLDSRISIDMIRLTGPRFADLDNRLVSLWMVKMGLTDVAIFDANKQNVQAGEFLYRKSVLVVRGSFRPATLVNQDMIRAANEQFRNEEDVDSKKTFLMTEITLDNLCSTGELDEKDFLDRADLLAELNQTVIISNCEKYTRLIRYLADYKISKLGMVIGVRQLLDLITEKYYNNMDGQLLAAFGEVFNKNVRLYVYPSLQEGSEELMTAKNLPIPEGVKFLYQHILDNEQIKDLTNYNEDNLHIFSNDVLDLLRKDEGGWEGMVSKQVAELIKKECLFGFPSEQMEFKY